MPEKDGDEGKSTKSVVNKKQKQMMGEEGYDIARDMGKVRPSKDKKDATTLPVSDEVKKTQKVNKGPSAFERVKAKYGKSVMNVGKKKANEELDLSKVAEAFDGYIVEANGKKKKSSNKDGQKFDSGAVGTTPSGSPDMAGTQKQFVQQGRQSVDPENVLSNEPIRISDKNFSTLLDRVSGKKTSAQQDAEIGGEKKKGPADYNRGKLLQSPEYYKKKRGEVMQGRKEYIDPKTNKASPEGVKKYISKARQMRTGSNEPVDQKTTDNIAKIAGKEYEDKINQKYGGKLARKRGKDQPTFPQVKAKIDDVNPVRTSPVSGGKIPDTRKPKSEPKPEPKMDDPSSDYDIEQLKKRGMIDKYDEIKRTTPKGGMPKGTVDAQGNITPFSKMMQNVEKAQQKSTVAATGGLLAKTANPALAGVEAMSRFKSGDKKGALLSTVQSIGGPIGFAAGVLNAIKTRTAVQAAASGGDGGRKGPRITSSGGEFDREGPKPTRGGASSGGGDSNTGDTLSGIGAYQLAKDTGRALKNLGGLPGIRGGRAIQVSAKQ